MSPAEQFLTDYLAAKLRAQEQWAELFEPVRARFFRSGYRAFDPQSGVDRSRREHILQSEIRGDGADIITTGLGEHHRLRYLICQHEDAFSIDGVEVECGLCSRAGGHRRGCRMCGGTGWTSFL
jgi:hypothetical protein